LSAKITQPLPVEMTRPPVAIKGTKNGLLFVLDETCAFEMITGHLQDLWNSDKGSLFDGPLVPVSVDYGNREFSTAETNSLLQLFMNQSNFQIREWGPRTSARQALFSNRKRLTPQSIHKGTVRAGQRLLFDGDVVVIGDVNPGGEIAATGDIYVFGRLRGIAHAGSSGDIHAVIAASGFSPMQLRIAHIVTRAPELDGQHLSTTMEFAYLRDDGMAVDKIQYLASLRHHV